MLLYRPVNHVDTVVTVPDSLDIWQENKPKKHRSRKESRKDVCT